MHISRSLTISKNLIDLINFRQSFNFYNHEQLFRFSTHLVAARLLLCISFLMFSFRILHMLTVSRNLGPQLLTLRKMVNNCC